MLRKLEPPLCLPFLIKGLTNRVWFACAQIFAEYPCVDELESRLRLCIFLMGKFLQFDWLSSGISA